MPTFDESLLRILIATAISTAVLGYGLRGKLEPPREGVPQADLYRRTRWLFVFAGIVCSLMTLYVAQVSTAIRTANNAPIIFAIVLVGVIVGVVLLRRGIRGNRVGDHPHCRRCGFDLFGRPAESVVCNECGADLNDARAIVTGMRQRRLVPLLAGAFLITLSAAIGVSMGGNLFLASAALTITQYQPTSWLVREFDSNAGPSLALAELNRRMSLKQLDAATIEHLAQPVPLGPTSMWVDTFAEFAWASGQLSEATMRKQLRVRLGYQAILAPQSTPTRIGFTVIANRNRSLRYQDWIVDVIDRKCEIDGIAMPSSVVHSTIRSNTSLMRVIDSGRALGNVLRPPTPLPPGRVNVKLTETIVGTLSVGGQPTLTESLDVKLLDGQTLVVADDDANDLADVPTDTESESLIAHTSAATIRLDWLPDDTTDVRLSIISDPGTRFSGKAYLRDGTVDTLLGDATFIGGRMTTSTILPTPPPEGVVEIVLKPTVALSVAGTRPSLLAYEIVLRAPIIERVHALGRDHK